MKSLILFCLVILSVHTTTAHAANESRPGQFDQQQDEEARRKELERRERALRAESTREVTAVGVDDYDCLRQVNIAADRELEAAIRDCNSQTEGIVSCHIASRYVSRSPNYISPVSGSGHYDERKTTEDQCRVSSASEAESDALSDCRDKYRTLCEVTSGGQVTSHDTYTRRRFYIAGPKEEYHECRAVASAAPPSMYTRACSVTVVARAR